MITQWNLQEIMKGFNLPMEDWLVQQASNLSKFGECTVKNQLGGEFPKPKTGKSNSQANYDVIAPDDHWAKYIEVRGSYEKADFSPSTSTGAKRSFEQEKFEEKIGALDSYVVFDFNPIKDGPLDNPRQYEIPAELIDDLFALGALGKAASIGFPERQNYGKSHGREWYERPLRFKELFPYEQFAFEPNSAKKNYPTAGELVESAIKRIQQKLENKRGK